MRFFLSVSVSLLAVYVVNFIRRRKKAYKLREKIGLTGPPVNFFLGTVGEFVNRSAAKGYDDSYNLIKELHEKYGTTFGMFMGPELQIFSSSPEFAKECFIKQFSNFGDRVVPDILTVNGMNGSLLQISNMEGWKDVRSCISPVFSTGKLKLMYSSVDDKINVFIGILQERAKNKETFDIFDDLNALTMDVIGKCAFAIESNCQKNRDEVTWFNLLNFLKKSNKKEERNDKEKINRNSIRLTREEMLYRTAFLPTSRESFRSYDVNTNWLMIASFMLPEFNWLWKRCFPYTKTYAAEKPLIEGLAKVYDMRRELGNSESVDLLQLLLNKEDNQTSQLLSGWLVTRRLAGYETTSTALTYCTYLLGKHQDIQEKLVEEIREYKQREGLTFESIMSMKYLEAVFKEVLRFYPPVIHFTSRRCINDTEVCGIPIPKGTIVQITPYVTHRDESEWSDANKFLPERFLESNEKNALNWIPFGVGPRNCVGQRFAKMEWKMIMVKFLDKFQIHLPPGEKELVSTVVGSIMRPLGAVNIQVTERKLSE